MSRRSIAHTNRSRRYVYAKLLRLPDLAPDQRHLIRQGIRQARLIGSRRWGGWALESLTRGDLVSAAKQGRHALIDLGESLIG